MEPSTAAALPAGYRDLFETMEPRIYGEAGLFADVVAGGPLDLSRIDRPEALDTDPALTIIASPDEHVYARHSLAAAASGPGEFRINPLYAVERRGNELSLRLRFRTPITRTNTAPVSSTCRIQP